MEGTAEMRVGLSSRRAAATASTSKAASETMGWPYSTERMKIAKPPT